MKRHAPAAARNAGPLGDVLEGELPKAGLVLEIASGSGQHAVDFARRFPALEWQPSDGDANAIASIAAYRAETDLPNLRAPVLLDAAQIDWAIERADAVVCINMVHISPWAATEGLFAGAARSLASASPLILYGPFFEPDIEMAASNIAFDGSLRQRNSAWGLRDIAALDVLAEEHGFARRARHAMPANNLTLVYRKV